VLPLERRVVENARWVEVIAALQRLDSAVKVRAAQLAAAPQAEHDLRGLYISEQEFAQLVSEPLTPPADVSGASKPTAWQRLQAALKPSPFERDVLLLCLALELDRGYERIFAYLHDDVTARQPTVGLALDLLCDSPAERIAARRTLAPRAPLRDWGLIRLLPGRDDAASLLARPMALASGVAAALLEGNGLPRWLDLSTPDTAIPASTLPSEPRRVIEQVGAQSPDGLWIHLISDDEGESLLCAQALATRWGLPLLRVDAPHLPERATILRRAARDALLIGAALCVPHAALEAHPPEAWADAVRGLPLPILWGDAPANARGTPAAPWPPLEAPGRQVIRLEIASPSFERRRHLWGESLRDAADHGLDLDAVAGRYRLSRDQIARAAQVAQDAARQRHGDDGHVAMDDLFAAARAVSSPDLGSYAQRIPPRHTWHDIVLPEDQLAQLHELCDQFRYRHVVYDAWSMGGRSQLGRGLSVLFAGPSGTGKTLAAEVIARELQLDLFKIDLSGIVSKYVGETEKNLERIFAQARHANAILLFDEADALFGKRSETKDAHDRYANIEISYLLQKVEEYDGVVILTSNLQQNLDEAFLRRLHFVVAFPMPDEPARQRIWAQHLPDSLPRAANLDASDLAGRWKFSGGSIRNVALSAAFLAARDGEVLTHTHLLWAARREFQKLGKLVDERLFAPDEPGAS